MPAPALLIAPPSGRGRSGPQFHTTCALDRLLRYGHLLWLFTYFFVATVEYNPNRNWRNNVFDVVQSASAATAAVFLGFVLPLSGLMLPLPEQQGGYVAASGAVIVTCGLSLGLFGPSSDRQLNLLRALGLSIGIASLLFAAAGTLGKPGLMIVGGLQFLLWILLLIYWRVRLGRSG